MNVCLVGASGLVGNELLKLLIADPQVTEIKALTRRPLEESSNKLQNIITNFDKLEECGTNAASDVFMCCLGTTIKVAGSQDAFRKVDHDYVVAFARLAEKVKAQKFLVVSAMGANASSGIFYNRVKGQMEGDLQRCKIAQIEVFRPALILGQRKEQRGFEKFAQAVAPVTDLLMVGPLKKYRAIRAVDIAKAMHFAAKRSRPGFTVHESSEVQALAGS